MADMTSDFEATVALLRGLSGAAPIETHISLVFVGADTVWKLRKPVRLAFVDFTGVAERRRTALREVELNAPHAPGMYRDVVAVVRGADGRLALGGEGEAVDWVVRMARVPAEDFLAAIAARGGLTPALLDALGDAVAAMHTRLPAVGRDQAAALRAVTAGNAESALQAGLPAESVAAWRAAMEGALDGCAAWLRGRGIAGFVRRIHGDLHLGNICLWRGRPAAFDALEFDEALAVFDVGYDVAFLLMDLDVRAGRAAANRVFNRYVARTGDVGLVRGLPVFLSMRAMVRAHVEARQGHASAGEYLARALAYLHPPPAVVVAIGGLMGTGKTTLARRLAPGLGAAPGALHLRSDEIRKRQQGVGPEEKLPATAYTAAASRAVFEVLVRDAAAAVAAGHAVVADATFMDLGHRVAIAQAAGEAAFLGVWLEAPMAVLEARVAGRRGDASDADVGVLRRAAAADPGAGEWLAVDASDGDAALAAVIAALPNG
jgi:aminoglycoside phosphotransferase family enzyme/predicted kinase